MMKNYIGLATTFHDSAISIVDSNGKVVFAEATERYLQNKRAVNFGPDVFVRVADLIKKYCDPSAQLVVSHSWSDKTPELMKKQLDDMELLRNTFIRSLGYVPDYMNSFMELGDYCSDSQISACDRAGRTLKYELNINQSLVDYRKEIETRRYNHHLAHAAAACYTSPYEKGVCAIVDGYGEVVASNIFVYNEGKIKEIEVDRESNTASLGLFYTFICEACGFGQLTGEEWKIMGLAAYGKLDHEIYQLLKSVIKVNGMSFEWQERHFAAFFSEMETLRRKKGEPVIHSADMAYTGQLVFTELLFEYLNHTYDYLKDEYGADILDNLILGGGCALNSSANGMITERTKFKNLFVFSAPGDDGNAVGAALLAYHQDHPECGTDRSVQTPYLGSEISERQLSYFIQFSKVKTFQDEADAIVKRAAELLAQGKIIGWIQGRAEFGPRALGNRSILADPRSPEMKEIINARVKFREEFRPFAPSILHEFGPDYFENYQESPYMERTLRFKKEVLDKVPAVVHKSGTGRLQTVKREWNERYYSLINEFYNITSIPLVLNTSLNIMGKPIVHSVEDAIALFYTCGLDALVFDHIMIEK